MARGKVYDLAIKIAGRVDSSLKKACLDADEQLGELAKTAEKIGKAAKVAAGVTTAAIGAVGVASVKAYTEHQQAANSMAAATGAAGEQLEYLQDAMDTVYTDNYGESLQDVADAVSLVDRNMKISRRTKLWRQRRRPWPSRTLSSMAWRKAHAPRRPSKRILVDPRKKHLA